MTILEKLSDRNSFIFEAIKLILVNMGPMDPHKLQWQLFCHGIYVKKDLLLQAISVMKEKKMISRPPEPAPLSQDVKEKVKIITDVFQKEESKA